MTCVPGGSGGAGPQRPEPPPAAPARPATSARRADLARVLPLIGAVGVALPLLWKGAATAAVMGYLLALWLVLIAGAALIAGSGARRP